jgi:hypothetical protein
MITTSCFHDTSPIDLLNTPAASLSYILDFMKSPSTYYTKPKKTEYGHPSQTIRIDEIESVFDFAHEYECEHVTQAFGLVLDQVIDLYTAELVQSKVPRYHTLISDTEFCRLFRMAAEGGFPVVAAKVVKLGGCYGDSELEYGLPRSHMHPAAWPIDVSLRVPQVYYFALVKACAAATRSGLDLYGQKSIDRANWAAVSRLFLEQMARAQGLDPDAYKDPVKRVQGDTGDW